MFSPVKIILLVAVVAAVYFASRIFRKGIAQGEENATKNGGKGSASKSNETELLKCPECGTFVASLEDHHCQH